MPDPEMITFQHAQTTDALRMRLIEAKTTEDLRKILLDMLTSLGTKGDIYTYMQSHITEYHGP